MTQKKRAPVLFVGHGNPMNAIGDNRARSGWQQLARTLEKPRAIAAVSAHWLTQGRRVRTAADNPQIYDMYGFPEALYRVKYAPAGSVQDAERARRLLGAAADNSWGIDHGVWTVLCNLFPAADVPVVTISVDGAAPARAQYEAGQALAALREEGVLILASGNAVHNLGRVDWDMAGGFGWAERFDAEIKKNVLSGSHEAVIGYESLENSRLAVPTAEHFLPLLTALGASAPDDRITVFNDYCELGSMSMTSYLFQ